MMNADVKENVEARLKRVAGQVAGVQRMVDGDRYCVDILTQIAAVRAALAKTSSLLLQSHIETCVAEAFEGTDPASGQEKISELIRVFDRSCR